VRRLILANRFSHRCLPPGSATDLGEAYPEPCSRGNPLTRVPLIMLAVSGILGHKKTSPAPQQGTGEVVTEIYLFLPGIGIALTGISASKLMFFGKRSRSDFRKSSHLSRLPV